MPRGSHAKASLVSKGGRENPRQRFTFRGNLSATRHGWLRLTPAYSVHFVRELLADSSPSTSSVLDPFCGTGTTLLACAERGVSATTIDLNPFLVWLARAKTARYDTALRDEAAALVRRMEKSANSTAGATFVPDIHRVDRWWNRPVLGALGRAAASLRKARDATSPRALDLASVAFCRTLILTSNVSFGHQSMSFQKGATPVSRGAGRRVAHVLAEAFESVAASAVAPLARSRRQVLLGDSRAVSRIVSGARFSAVVTSPPYSNRMSYIRELRPYMYWLGHLVAKKDAGELDWRAIGGTWGAATSRLATWQPDRNRAIPFAGFDRIVEKISDREPLLGHYVHRYFEDMASHIHSLVPTLLPGAQVRYVVGNSKFYDVMLPAQEIFCALFESAGLSACRITEVRKRTSKRELYEYLVEATLPQGASAAKVWKGCPLVATK
jgi:SAM-dependent methyltransferase